MGELRNSIVELQKQVTGAAKLGDKIGADLELAHGRVDEQFQRLQAGADVMWMYLVAYFEKSQRDIKDHMNDKLSDHADSEIVKYLKGLDAAANDVLRTIGDFDKVKAQMPGEYAKIDQLATSIKRNIDKKRAKLFQSKKYKAKLAGYEKALDELVKAIGSRRKAFDEITTIKRTTVEEMRMKPTAKISEVENLCTMSIKAGIKNMKAQVEQGKWVSRKFRENGDLKQAFSAMKQWAGEADSMDQEVINLDPTATKPIKDVRIFEGTRLVGTAPKAVFQGKRPMEVTPVTWEKGVDILKLLQKKLTVRAKYATGDGEFAHDMKVNGIKDKTIKLV